MGNLNPPPPSQTGQRTLARGERWVSMAKVEEEGEGDELTLSAAIHRVQLALLDDGPCTDRQLFAAGGLLSRPDYEDVVVERSIVGLCGYPACPNPLPADRPRRGHYRISLSEHKVYDLEETYKFCSEACVVGSRAFSGSLQPERCPSTGPGRVAELLRLFEDLSFQRRPGPRRRRPRRAAEEDGDFGFSKLTIHEKSEVASGDVTVEEWIGPSNAIEGYVPQRERNQGADVKRKAKSKPKEKPMPAKFSIDIDEIASEFASSVIVGEPFSIAAPGPSSSVLASNGLEQGVPRLEDAHVGKGEVNEKGQLKEPPALKSSLKTSGAKSRNRTVKWADEENVEALEESARSVAREVSEQRRESSTTLSEEDEDSSQRLASAEACVAALVQAADSVASGELESVDAATEAGIVILPLPIDSEEMDFEADEDAFEFDKGFVKWPKKTVLLDTDMFEVEDSWHDTPPEGFCLTVGT
ncbi:hypothetical protein Taro_040436 [Colocasia esculenta]|uniref:RNA polymerase II subunit B1 CTD phosphatase RPAP2 homolog n=1 Tax=Colocasia esculenta TaxID=4460 RepID=A0A843WIQ8_COLES|nr:hypothetical protein [Colocasia esculenta]